METTASARLGRTLSTSTQPGANEPGGIIYNPKDMVDVWRRASSKNVSARRGPYPVVRVDADAGQHCENVWARQTESAGRCEAHIVS